MPKATWFVWRLHAEAGAQVWVDTTIRVRHIHPFLIDESFQERFADYAIPGVGPADICQHVPAEEKLALVED